MVSVSSYASLPRVYYCLQWDVCSNKALPMYFDYIDCFLIECWEFLIDCGCKTLIWHVICKYQVFPGGASGKESACQYRRRKSHGFDPWVGKILWSRKWKPILVFLPGKFHGQRNLMGYNPGGCKELYMTEHTHIYFDPHMAQNLKNGVLFYLHEFKTS